MKLTFSPLKMDCWNTIVSFWVPLPIFRGELAVSFRECNFNHFLGGGFKHFLFSPLPGEDFPFD